MKGRTNINIQAKRDVKTRILAWLMTVALVLSMIPSSALTTYAAEEETAEVEAESATLASVTASDCLTFASAEEFTLAFGSNLKPNGTLEYSTDGETWQSFTSGTTVTAAETADGVYHIYLRGTGNTRLSTSTTASNTRLVLSGTGEEDVSCAGNIETLLDYETVQNGGHPTMDEYAFYSLFYNNTILSSAPELAATELSAYCYGYMFAQCRGLLEVPELPATTLADYCYEHMFMSCAALTEAPEITADTIATGACYYMYCNCSSLLSAGDILATTVEDYGCAYMYYNCQALTKAADMPNAQEIGEEGCCLMYEWCCALEKSPVLPATTLGTKAYYCMFYECKALTEAPDLPATTVGTYAYSFMFYDCASLVNIPNISAKVFGQYACYYMFGYCTSLTGILPDFSDITVYDSNTCFYMFYGCTSLIVNSEPSEGYNSAWIYTCAEATNASTGSSTQLSGMFTKTGGTFTGTAVPGTAYYVMDSGVSFVTNGGSAVNDVLAAAGTVIDLSNYTTEKVGGTFVGWYADEEFTEEITSVTVNGRTVVYALWTTDTTLADVTIEDPETMYYTSFELEPELVIPQATIGNSTITYTYSTDGTNFSADIPTFTEVGDYTIYYRMEAAGYDTVTKSLTVTVEGGTYLVFYSDSSFSVTLKNYGIGDGTIERSLDGGKTWVEETGSSGAGYLVSGKYVVLYRGTGNTYLATGISTDNYSYFSFTGSDIHCVGYAEALLDYETVEKGESPEMDNYAFAYLFYGCSRLVSAPDILSEKLSTSACYRMFYNCTNLTKAPTISATTFGSNSCSYMFYGCTSLEDASNVLVSDKELTLGTNCFQYMFQKCTSLTEAPTINTTSLGSYSCYYMFAGCTSLEDASNVLVSDKELTLGTYCFQYMFNGCTSLITPPTWTAAEYPNCSCGYMFNGCSSLMVSKEQSDIYSVEWITTPATINTYALSYFINNTGGATTGNGSASTTYYLLDRTATCTLTFDTNGGDAIESIDVSPTDTVDLSEYVPTREGYEFLGWYSDEDLTKSITTVQITSDTTIYAGWSVNVEDLSQVTLAQQGVLAYTGEAQAPTMVLSQEEINGSIITVTYSTSADGTYTDELPTYTAAGEYTLYYQLRAAGYESIKATATVTVVDVTGCIVFSSSEEFTLGVTYQKWNGIVEYSTDGSTWTTWSDAPSNAITSGKLGDLYCVLLRGTGNTYFATATTAANRTTFSLTANSAVYCNGNIENLLDYSTVASGSAVTMGSYCFSGLFYNCTALASAPELPATSLATYCYYYMFTGCTSLVEAPELPATSLASYCYSYMFTGCTSLVEAPDLPATTLVSYCYEYMFYNCKSLEVAPEIAATTLATYCCQYMFVNCTSLVTPPELYATYSYTYCYRYMFNGCTSLMVSKSTSSIYTRTWRLPYSGTMTTSGSIGFNYYFIYKTGGATTYTSTSNYVLAFSATYYLSAVYTLSFETNGGSEIRSTVKNVNTEVDLSNYVPTRLGATFAGWYADEALTEPIESITLTEDATVYAAWEITDLSCATVKQSGTLTYTGSDLTATLAYSNTVAGADTPIVYTFSTTEDGEYTADVPTFVDAGTHTVYYMAEAEGFASATGSFTVTIDRAEITNVSIMAADALYYTGEAQSVELIACADTVDDCDYLIMYSENGVDYTSDWSTFTFTELGTYQIYYLVTAANHNSASGYFYITVTTSGATTGYVQFYSEDTFTIKFSTTKTWNGTVEYSTDGETWTEWNGIAITVDESSGYNVYFRGEGNTTITGETTKSYFRIVSQKSVYCSGDLKDLLDYTSDDVTMDPYALYRLFYNCTTLASAPSLSMETLSDYCYGSMFYNCTALRVAPSLPAENLYEGCYSNMFYGCVDLLITPTSLPATTLVKKCYYRMFYGCEQITAAPQFGNITIVAEQSCYGMFYNCYKLKTIYEINATVMQTECFAHMYNGCSALTAAPALPATTLAEGCYRGMFTDCVALTSAPELPATELAERCYQSMFEGCESLEIAPALPATTLEPYCYYNMFNGCIQLETAPTLPAEDLANYCYYGMFKNCTSLTTAPALPATTLADYCYYSMFEGCESLATAPELPATTLTPHCYQSMFKDCVSLTAVPTLPATTLAEYCYRAMFSGCTGLTALPLLAATTLENYCYSYMFSGCVNICVSEVATGEYVAAWSVPAFSTGTEATNWNLNMLEGTGLYTDDPAINTTYYVPGIAITFVTNGGTDTGVTHICTGSAYDVDTVFVTTKDGYEFAGWYSDASLTQKVDTIIATASDEITLYAAWTALVDLSGLEITVEGDYTYNGEAQTIALVANVTSLGDEAITFTYSLDGTTYSDTVAITDAGDYTIYYKATCGEVETSGTVEVTMALADMTDVVVKQNGIIYYDGTAQSPEMILTATTADGSEATFVFSATTYGTMKSTLPTYTEDGDYTLYYQITADNHNTITGSTTIAVRDVTNCIAFTSDSAFNISMNSVKWENTIEYYKNGNWITWSGGLITSVAAGDKQVIYLRGVGNTYVSATSSTNVGYFVINGEDVSCSGNLENLLDYATVAAGGHPEMASYAFYKLFYKCTNLVSAPTLGADEVSAYGYAYMFYGCTALTEASELPATTIGKMAYGDMFYGCTSLETAPDIAATNLGAYSCYYMFANCTALTDAPELAATTMANNCYGYMFTGCTSLVTIKELPATTLADYCYQGMYKGCTSLEELPVLAATEMADYCYMNMFNGCTSIKVSSTFETDYSVAWRVPSTGTGTEASYWNTNMLKNTGGTYTGDPDINTTYYLPGLSLTFDTGLGTSVNPVSVSFGTNVDLTAYTTERDGYYFTGWYTDSACTNAVTEIEIVESAMVYAGFVEESLDGVTVTQSGEATCTDSTSATVDLEITSTTIDLDKVTITYSLDGETYTDEIPSFDEEGEYTLYYKIEAEGFDPVVGTTIVTVTKTEEDDDDGDGDGDTTTPDDDDSTTSGDDGTTPDDDSTTPGDDGTTSGDDGTTSGDDDTTSGDSTNDDASDGSSSSSSSSSSDGSSSSGSSSSSSSSSGSSSSSSSSSGTSSSSSGSSGTTASTSNSTTTKLSVGDTYTKSGVTYQVTDSKEMIITKGDKTLTEAKISSTLTVGSTTYTIVGIGARAFKNCKKLTTVTIPKTVTSVGSAAFAGCTKLKTVTINAKLTEIASKTFYGCKALTTVKIGSTVTKIGAKAFFKCTSLKKVTGCKNVKTVGARAFCGCTSLKSVAGLGKVTKIDTAAFAKCSALTTIGSKSKVITLKKVKTIGTKAFYKCTSIKKVNITSTSLTTINARAFYKCSAMTTFVAKSTKLTTIGKEAFYYSKKLAKVTLKTKKLTSKTVKTNAFKGIAKKCTFKVPKAKKNAYKKLFIKKGAKKTIKVK